MRWLRRLFTARTRERVRRLDHAHGSPSGDRVPLADLDAIRREWR